MNVTKDQKDALNAVVTIDVAPEDYQPKVKDSLKKLGKQITLKGFRKGMVPPSIVQKMYGNQVLAEELDKLLQDQLNNYLKEEAIEILGNPLPTEQDDLTIDISAQKPYSFSYELGLSPEFDIAFLDPKTKVERFTIKVDDKTLDKEIDRMRKQFGQMTNPEDAKPEDDDVLVIELTELDEAGNVKEGGVTNNTSVAFDMLTDATQKKLAKLKPGDTVNLKWFDILGKEKADAAKHLLNLGGEALETLNDEFQLKLDKINRMDPAELNQELFDKVFGADAVDSEEAFREKMKEELAKVYGQESDKRLGYDIVTKLLEETNIDLPEDFLKRWIKRTNEKPITDQQLEDEFEAFARNLRWNLIVNKVSKDNDIKVEPEEVKEHTKQQILAQFGGMGGNFPDEQLDQWASSMLQNKEHVQRTFEQLLDNKLIDYIKGQITVKDKEVSLDEFNKKAE